MVVAAPLKFVSTDFRYYVVAVMSLMWCGFLLIIVSFGDYQHSFRYDLAEYIVSVEEYLYECVECEDNSSDLAVFDARQVSRYSGVRLCIYQYYRAVQSMAIGN